MTHARAKQLLVARWYREVEVRWLGQQRPALHVTRVATLVEIRVDFQAGHG